MLVVWAGIGLERVKGGLKQFGKGARVKKGGWGLRLKLIILHFVIPHECLSCMEKHFPSSNPHSAAVSFNVANKTTHGFAKYIYTPVP